MLSHPSCDLPNRAHPIVASHKTPPPAGAVGHSRASRDGVGTPTEPSNQSIRPSHPIKLSGRAIRPSHRKGRHHGHAIPATPSVSAVSKRYMAATSHQASVGTRGSRPSHHAIERTTRPSFRRVVRGRTPKPHPQATPSGHTFGPQSVKPHHRGASSSHAIGVHPRATHRECTVRPRHRERQPATPFRRSPAGRGPGEPPTRASRHAIGSDRPTAPWSRPSDRTIQAHRRAAPSSANPGQTIQALALGPCDRSHPPSQ
ncbi:hypothetical protein APR08_004314 [Nocardia amikacinitolerans]|nr:hypothetical protein [Nocardia amikacinitolerans]